VSLVDFTWLIGGPQGSGVESGANIFSKVCAQDLGLFTDAPPILSSSMPFDVVPGEEPDPLP